MRLNFKTLKRAPAQLRQLFRRQSHVRRRGEADATDWFHLLNPSAQRIDTEYFKIHLSSSILQFIHIYIYISGQIWPMYIHTIYIYIYTSGSLGIYTLSRRRPVRSLFRGFPSSWAANFWTSKHKKKAQSGTKKRAWYSSTHRIHGAGILMLT